MITAQPGTLNSFLPCLPSGICTLKVFSLLANVADVKSLVIHPASTTHSQLNDEELAEQQIYQNTIRLSIGTEHIDDIIADLEAGFAAVRILHPRSHPKAAEAL